MTLTSDQKAGTVNSECVTSTFIELREENCSRDQTHYAEGASNNLQILWTQNVEEFLSKSSTNRTEMQKATLSS